MKHGNWLPIDKNALRYLPRDRAFTELEALVSLQADYDQESDISVAGYAAMWKWSRGKVTRFLGRLGVVVNYPCNTQKKQNQRGQIVIQMASKSEVKREQIRLIDSKGLDSSANRSKDKVEQITDRSQSTTKEPNPKPKKTMVDFDEFWTHYPRKISKKSASKAWIKIKPDQVLFETIMKALEQQKNSEQWQKVNGSFIPHATTWLNQERWTDEVELQQEDPVTHRTTDKSIEERIQRTLQKQVSP